MIDKPDTPSLVGATIGNYRVLSLLGAGAMGEVYLGEHPRIGRKVAIKVLVAALSVNPEMAARFVSEAKAVNTINHPNIIQIFDFGELPDGRLYFTMEFLEGRELTGHIAEHAPLPLGEIKGLLEQLSGALDAAHETGIVHRDLKPDNIFLAEGRHGPVVKILDFGIAKLIEPGLADGTSTTSGVIMGTPLYMSPEQAAGQTRDISPRSDVYALGVILYQLLSAHLPIQAKSTAELLYRHIAEPPIPLEQVAADLPPAVGAVVAQSLAKEPDARQQSAGELYRQFVQACGEAPGALTATVAAAAEADLPSVRPRPISSTLGASASQAISTPSAASSGRRPSAAVWGLAGLGVVALVVLGFFLVTGRLGGSGPGTSRAPAPASSAPMGPVAPTKPVPPAPRPTVATRPTPPVALVIHRVSVEARSGRTRVDVSIGGRLVHRSRKAPFAVEARAGERITLTARRRGHGEQTESFLVRGDRRVRFALQRQRPGARPRPPRVEPRVVLAPVRPRPMTIVVRARPRPRPVLRPRPRPRPMDNIDVGTLRPMF